ncbi:AfsR/SARP family transcriptional regulator [Kibdelosporangium philippinense]|uniref:AfsR/SARP family transcriptional regulator n=1 Tax=Kibdelosporangium philippinense TaxID=211113 RepID=A0ABS8Z8W2_9PSEU|nr:BTAD domain-containing putative transcriptional regulator [Kibdelosporangium philippinense]MCE7004324.1 AfsR/SARP family transcriptional regulator [Kibdelosporangium philippinense]
MAVDLILLSRVSYCGKEITGPRMRNLFAALAGDLRTGCSAARLVNELWPDQQPEKPAKALQILVSRARSQLGSDLIVSTPTGYRLSLNEDQVDTSAVLLSASASAQCYREGDHAAALTHAEAGLACWDGAEPSDDLVDPLSMLRAERVSTYRSLVRMRAMALSRLGRHADAVEPLIEVFRERPRDEEVLLELLRSESATAGPSAAITRYESYRRSLRDELGTDPGHGLQDMHQQLLHGSLPVRATVPADPNPMVGRDADIAAVTSMISSSRVTSIVGPGGLGKTRLAYAVSRQVTQQAVYLVALAGVAADEEVIGAVSSALGVGGKASEAVSGIATAVGNGPTLLVLDNCEHVVHGVAELVQALVAMRADLSVLTTSRAPLGISSESVYLLPELSLRASMELFVNRAKAARSTVDLNPAAVEDICRKLDGLPLALELAAARVPVMSIADIAARLADRFALLRSGARDAPERHRTLQAVIDWSWNLLDAGCQAAMRALSIFPDGFTADAAQHMLEAGDVLDVLTQLTQQSLLKVTDTPSGTRYRMLETVREFSTARMEPGEVEKVTRRFVEWARDFGIAHHEALFETHPAPLANMLRAEQDNLQLALRHALDLHDSVTVAATTSTLGMLWLVESNFARLAWLITQSEWILSHARPQPAHVGIVRMAAAVSALYAFIISGPHATRSTVTLRRLPSGSPRTFAGAIQEIVRTDDPSSLCDRDEPMLAVMACLTVTFLRQVSGDMAGALAMSERTLTVAKAIPGPLMTAMAHSRVGELYLKADQGARAQRHLATALSLLGDMMTTAGAIRGTWALTMASLQTGDLDTAERLVEEVALLGGHDVVGLAIRSELMLARGQIDAGLRSWRRVVDRMSTTDDLVLGIERSIQEAWWLETHAASLTAHAQHGRLAVVQDTAQILREVLTDILTNRPSPPNFPCYGTVLLAIATVLINSGRPREGARMTALAEAFQFSHGFQPTLAPARARAAAEQADQQAYAEAQATYAKLDTHSLPAAALAAIAQDRG